MSWEDALKIGTVVIGSLGGGGAIVLAFSKVLGGKWLQSLKGEIDAKLHRLEAELQHRNFVRQRFAEFELIAITECWRAARNCLPLINATRPHDSGTDDAVLVDNATRLADAHNALIEAVGRHEPFLGQTLVAALDSLSRTIRLELSHIQHHERFRGPWWEEGAANSQAYKETCDTLLSLVRSRVADLRSEADAETRSTG